MSEAEVRREAVARQGSRIVSSGQKYLIQGTKNRAEFEQGGEGLVHLATNEDTGIQYRIKCFWDPNEVRKQRSLVLAQQQLADLGKKYADALGGAPFDVLGTLGPYTPFAVVMKNVNGSSWKNLKEMAGISSTYPPLGWPNIKIRATWAYGLAVAVKSMEDSQFIHADLSPGNVMVTPSGPQEGDMALVDFDGFVHPCYPNLDTTIKGSEGYAAPEIFKSEFVRVSSDRTAMAILIQEFLFVGAQEIEPDYSFKWGYDQIDEINNKKGEAHPFIKQKFAPIAELVEKTLQAQAPEKRPSPDQWMKYLYSLANSGNLCNNKLTNLKLVALPPKNGFDLSIPDRQVQKNLLQSQFRIRANIDRDSNGLVMIVVHNGGELRVKSNKKSSWKILKGGERIYAEPQMQFFDPQGLSTAVLLGDQI
ncbi:MAG: protein kinase domain-containing protein [Candidatus Omnitrophota bacterium]